MEDLIIELKASYNRAKNRLYYAYQRARYGYDDSMLWNLDEYIVSHFLEQLMRFEKIVAKRQNNSDLIEYIDESKEAIQDYLELKRMPPWGLVSKRSKKRLADIFLDERFEKLWD